MRGRTIKRIGCVVGGCALLVLALAGGAASGTTAKPYHAGIAPATAASGSSQTYAYTFTNDTNQPLGSANITIPSGWTTSGTSISAKPAGKTWSATVNGSVIEVRSAASGDRLAQNEAVTVSFTGTAPVSCSTASYGWIPEVKQSNKFLGSGNDFFLTGGAPVVVVSPGPAALAGFSLAQVTSPQLAGRRLRFPPRP